MSESNGSFYRETKSMSAAFSAFCGGGFGFATDQYSTGIEKIRISAARMFHRKLSRLAQVNEFSRRMLQLLDH